MIAGLGATHVLTGAAVSVLRKLHGSRHEANRPPAGNEREPGDASEYSCLRHVIVVPQTKPGLAASGGRKNVSPRRPESRRHPRAHCPEQSPGNGTYLRTRRPHPPDRGVRPCRLCRSDFSRQRKPEVDEPILYGANTDGMLPMVLHPDEWLDGAIVPSLHSWFGGTETYFYQNHPIVLDLYRRHQAREINFVGTVATIAGADNFDRERNSRVAANLVKWNLRADGAVLTKYGGGLPHADLRKPRGCWKHGNSNGSDGNRYVARSARGIGIAVQYPRSRRHRLQRRQRHSLGSSAVDRVIAATDQFRELLTGPLTLDAVNVAGVTNQQGASRMRAMVY